MKPLSYDEATLVGGGLTAQTALMAMGPILGAFWGAVFTTNLSLSSIGIPALSGVAGVAYGYFVKGSEDDGYVYGVTGGMLGFVYNDFLNRIP